MYVRLIWEKNMTRVEMALEEVIGAITENPESPFAIKAKNRLGPVLKQVITEKPSTDQTDFACVFGQ